MTSRRAVVFYEVGATRTEKVDALKEGLVEIVRELIDEGVQLDEIAHALDDAHSAAEFECPS